MTWDKAIDDGSTPTYDNFIVEYIHFEGGGGVGSSLPPSMSTMTSATTRSSPPPPQSVTPHTPASTATPPGTSTMTPARVEHNPVEFDTLLSHDKERIDTYHDGEPLWYHMMENLLGDQPVSGLVPHDLEARLHLACDDSEPRSFMEVERHTAWRAVMQSEMDTIEKNRIWEFADLAHGHSAITLKWVFKLKRDEAGAIVKHKSCLVARGFVQRKGIDFDDTFAPMAQIESVRLLFTLAA
jgi:hypothetical protein